MGAGQSKTDESTKHVFTSDTPIQFSQEYVFLEPWSAAILSMLRRRTLLNMTDFSLPTD